MTRLVVGDKLIKVSGVQRQGSIVEIKDTIVNDILVQAQMIYGGTWFIRNIPEHCGMYESATGILFKKANIND